MVSLKCYIQILFQSTLLQEERQLDCALKISIFNISIHAPTRGATIGIPSLPYQKKISIHAPTRGATGSDKVNLLTQIFQSTLLQEERRIRKW